MKIKNNDNAEDDEEEDIDCNDPPVEEDNKTEEWEGDDDDDRDAEVVETDDFHGTTALLSQRRFKGQPERMNCEREREEE